MGILSDAFTTELGLFDVLNWTFLLGWQIALYELLLIGVSDPAMTSSPFSHPVSPWIPRVASPFLTSQQSPLWWLIAVLEAGCWLDVLRMLAGTLRGNVVLGVLLHFIRTFVLLYVLPSGAGGAHSHSVCHVVLLAWAVTEVARYPYYIFSAGSTTKALR